MNSSQSPVGGEPTGSAPSDAANTADGMLAELLGQARFGFAVTDAIGVVQMINAALVCTAQWPSDDAAIGSLLGEQMAKGFPTAASRLQATFAGSESRSLCIDSPAGRYLLHVAAPQGGLRTVLMCPLADGPIEESSGLVPVLTHGRSNLINQQLLDRAIGQWSPGGPGPRSLVLLLVSLNRFNGVNDTLGYDVGDALLDLVAKRLQSITREGDMIMHLGGNEFAVLSTTGQQPTGALSVGKRIADLIGRVFLVKGHQVHIDASVGIAVLDGGTGQRSDLVRHADLAVRSIKGTSGGVRLFDPKMQDTAVRQRELEIALRRALVLNEFVLHYQPQLDLSTQQVIGFEALIRWQSGQHGMVSPADFIPLAEQLGEINAIGEWTVRTACAEAARWPSHISIAVNVSPVQFERGDLVGVIRSALTDSGLPPERLEIEITEGLLLSDSPTVLEQLRALQAMGLGVALDDFGTGFSSLSYLSSFPFCKLKIDRSFVQDESDRAQALVRSILALAKSLGLTTLAEGVETEQQHRALIEGGCDSAQGFLFGRPIPVDRLGDLIPRTEGSPA